ncbi:MAG: DUF4405 domain-containing protein [Anaerolineae bacterium]|nr:DUF4405 domain-containing protein [Anaerolineae bacterium]
MEPEKKKISLTNVNLLFDIVIFVAFLLSLDPYATGHAIHEWLGITLLAAIAIHLLIHWRWIEKVTAGFFRKSSTQARLNYVLNGLFFIDFVVVVFTGLMISEAALPSLGLTIGHSTGMKTLHRTSADLLVVILGLHAAIHWKWILNAIRRFIVQPVGRLFRRKKSNVVTVEVKA